MRISGRSKNNQELKPRNPPFRYRSERDARVERKDAWELKPLYIAVQLLLQSGANTEARAKHNYNPLHVAANCPNEKITHSLLQAGARIEAKTEHKSTPLHLASGHGNDAVVMVLLENGANTEVTTKEAMTPLFAAAFCANETRVGDSAVQPYVA